MLLRLFRENLQRKILWNGACFFFVFVFFAFFFQPQSASAAYCDVNKGEQCVNTSIGCPSGYSQSQNTCSLSREICCTPPVTPVTADDCTKAGGVCSTSIPTGYVASTEKCSDTNKTCYKRPTTALPSCAGMCATKDCPSDYDISSGTCTENRICCVPKNQTPPGGTSASCSGGACVKSGDPCPDKTEPKGACSSQDGGGTCCMPKSPGGGGESVNINFKNPLAYDTVEEVLNSILATLRSIIVTLALVALVVGAVLYITSAGSEKQMTVAKGAIVAAMIGLALGLAAPSFLKEIGNVLGWGAVNAGPVAGALTLSQIALNVLHFLLSVVGILAIIMLIVGGIMYLTSAGSEDRAETGKKIVLYSIIGIFVALASLVIVSQIAEFFMM